MPRVLVLGGGFGGLAAADELQRVAPDLGITVVSASDSFHMGFAKLWDLADERPLANGTVPLSRLHGRGIDFLQANVTAIDPATRSVTTGEGVLQADGLVVALGTSPAERWRAAVHDAGGHDLYDPAALPAMKAAIDRLQSGGVVIAILAGPFRCPPAPHEAALIVDERLRRRGVRSSVNVTVVTFQPLTLPAAGADASAFLAQRLADRGIELVVRQPVEGIDADRRELRFADRGPIPFDVLMAVMGDAPPAVVTRSPLAGPSGWIEPDRSSLRTPHDRVYAVGDCTALPTATGQLPKAGVFAAAQGVVAARNLMADLTGSAPTTFDGLGSCFLELPGRQVALIEGDFFAEPAPDVAIVGPSEAHYAMKVDYERSQLASWFGQPTG